MATCELCGISLAEEHQERMGVDLCARCDEAGVRVPVHPEARILAGGVPCSWCGAGDGERCRRPSGRRMGAARVHAWRIREAYRRGLVPELDPPEWLGRVVRRFRGGGAGDG